MNLVLLSFFSFLFFDGINEVATIGTTSSGAHDNLSEIRKVGGLVVSL